MKGKNLETRILDIERNMRICFFGGPNEKNVFLKRKMYFKEIFFRRGSKRTGEKKFKGS